MSNPAFFYWCQFTQITHPMLALLNVCQMSRDYLSVFTSLESKAMKKSMNPDFTDIPRVPR